MKIGWATAFKAPSLLQLSRTGRPTPAVADAALSVADLKPETSGWGARRFITGAKAYWRGAWKRALPRSRNDVDNRISISRTPDVNTPRGYSNFVGFETNSRGQRSGAVITT